MTDNPLGDDRQPDWSSISPAQATELLKGLTEDYYKTNPDAQPDTPAEAGQALAAMAKKPLPSVDPVGDAIARKLRNDVMVTSTPESPMLSPHKLALTVDALRESGFPDSGVEFILRDKMVTAADKEWARGEKDRLLADAEFVKRYLGGNLRDRHWMAGLTYILSAEVAGG
jgi:hypothetical protein